MCAPILWIQSTELRPAWVLYVGFLLSSVFNAAKNMFRKKVDIVRNRRISMQQYSTKKSILNFISFCFISKFVSTVGPQVDPPGKFVVLLIWPSILGVKQATAALWSVSSHPQVLQLQNPYIPWFQSLLLSKSSTVLFCKRKHSIFIYNLG